MASLSLCPQFETNLMLNRKIIELLLQLKSAKTHGKNYMKVKPHLVRHLLRNCLLETLSFASCFETFLSCVKRITTDLKLNRPRCNLRMYRRMGVKLCPFVQFENEDDVKAMQYI